MLFTLIYRSHYAGDSSFSLIDSMVTAANLKNSKANVSGILLFNGKHFFQLLEGSQPQVQKIYQIISQDLRHYNVVKLFDDFSPIRRFGRTGMELFDLRSNEHQDLLEQLLAKGTSPYQLTYEDRALQFFRSFVEEREKKNYFEIKDIEGWCLQPDFVYNLLIEQTEIASKNLYEINPLIDPLAQIIDTIEFIQPAENQNQDFTLELKRLSQQLSKSSHIKNSKSNVAINFLPQVLINTEDSVSILQHWVDANHLIPEQIILEFPEAAVLATLELFLPIISALKAIGFRIALDDFGSQFAALSLIAKFQPDRIKISYALTENIHQNGPKQAIVQAIIKCCTSLEISISALSIKQIEEWMWLESAGVNFFQGELFFHADLKGVPQIFWPERVADRDRFS